LFAFFFLADYLLDVIVLYGVRFNLIIFYSFFITSEVQADRMSSRLSDAHTTDLNHHLSELVGLTPLSGQQSNHGKKRSFHFIF